ncbi:MAG TPA: ABC transporter permease subunit [Ruminiclostridium sp.]
MSTRKVMNIKPNTKTNIVKYFKDLYINILEHKYLYLFLVPCLIFYAVFWIVPLYGIQIAFKDLKPGLGISKSPWVGLEYFRQFFSYYQLGRLFYNTIGISLLKIVFGFTAPIFLALMINEIKNKSFKKTIQTITYLPHFISWVIIANIIYKLFAYDGLANDALTGLFGGDRQVFMVNPKMFWPLIVITDVWKEAGFGSIIYLAAIAGLDFEVYEASMVDGASRLRQIWNITIPGILPTIMVMFILRVGGIMQAGFDQIWTLRNGAVAEVTDVLDVYTMIIGVQRGQYGYGAAVGIFTGVISLILMVIVNKLASKYSETSLW